MTRPRASTGLTFDDVCAMAAALPGVEVSTSYGTPALNVLVRLGVAKRVVVEQLLEDAWRDAAPKRLISERDARNERPTGKGDGR